MVNYSQEEYFNCISERDELYDISSYLILNKSEDLVVFSSTSWDKTCETIVRLNNFLIENKKSILAQKELHLCSNIYSDVCNEFNNFILKDQVSSLYVVPYLLMTIYDVDGQPINNVLFETIETKGKGDIFDCNTALLRMFKNVKWVYLISICDVVVNIEDIILTRYYMRLHNCHPKDKYCLIIDDNQKMYNSPVEYLKNYFVRINVLFANKNPFSFRRKYACCLMLWNIESTISKLYNYLQNKDK